MLSLNKAHIWQVDGTYDEHVSTIVYLGPTEMEWNQINNN